MRGLAYPSLGGGERVCKFFSGSLRRIPHEVTAQAQFDGKLRWVDIFGNDCNDSLAHTDGCAKLEEKVRLMKTVGLNQRHEHIAFS